MAGGRPRPFPGTGRRRCLSMTERRSRATGCVRGGSVKDSDTRGLAGAPGHRRAMGETRAVVRSRREVGWRCRMTAAVAHERYGSRDSGRETRVEGSAAARFNISVPSAAPAEPRRVRQRVLACSALEPEPDPDASADLLAEDLVLGDAVFRERVELGGEFLAEGPGRPDEGRRVSLLGVAPGNPGATPRRCRGRFRPRTSRAGRRPAAGSCRDGRRSVRGRDQGRPRP